MCYAYFFIRKLSIKEKKKNYILAISLRQREYQ